MTSPDPADFSATRQKAIDALCEHFANDALSVEEFERRVELAHRVDSTQELRELLADLPTGDLPIRRDDTGGLARDPARATVMVSDVRERAYLVAVMGGVERRGRWMPARASFGMACMGGLVLDFREALLAPGVTEVWILALMGGAEIIVPPDLMVESDGIAIMGGFDHRENVPLRRNPDAPILRLRGFAMMGGVTVNTRYPGETEREARQRLKLERKEQKRLGR